MDDRICIIGGGPNGIGVAKELQDAGLEYELFEAESDFGGVWNATSASGRVGPSTHLISSKSATQFPDFPMPPDYPHYPRHDLMLAYIRSFARAFGIYERARFNVTVRRLEPEAEGWRATLSTGETKRYSSVCVCSGLQRAPARPVPSILGEFAGETIHSMQYKHPDQLRGKRVVIVGAGNSGCDVAVDGVYYGDRVYLSMRRGYYFQPKFIGGKPTPDWIQDVAGRFDTRAEMIAYLKQVMKLAGYDGTDYGLPAPEYPLTAAHPIMNSQVLYHIGHGDIVVKGDVVRFDRRAVRFADGSSHEADLLVYATGYDRNIDFVDRRALDWKEGIPDLFLHIAPRNHDNLLFFGFVNSATGLGGLAKSSGSFAAAYCKARRARSRGYSKFLAAKAAAEPDYGRGEFIRSQRHLWEVDLWRYLKALNGYCAMLEGS